ncbi:hypothetical protein [Nesterenkonia ebinurensis]|uniref:hypothetical protein n=1 Tax=Nesterenkonia ebinurensis TaxID=2608252 RepID=UPI00123D28E2|nr:hypothetical protein [Nesterenkonia ebinurensis]
MLTSTNSAFASPAQEPTTGVESFITGAVEPHRNEFNMWKKTLNSHQMLLEDAKKRRKTESQQIGGTYLFSRRGRLIGGLDSGMTTLVSRQAKHACSSMQLTKQYLLASDVPQPTGHTFHSTQLSAAGEYVHGQGAAVLVKPATSQARPTISREVASSTDFTAAWKRAVDAVAKLPAVEQQINVEVYVPGMSLRVCTVGEEAVAALVRVPLYVVGNGDSTLEELTNAEKELRSPCSYLTAHFPTNNELFGENSVFASTDVPKASSIVLLTESADIKLAGNITVDVFDAVSNDLLSLAVDAMWAFPGLQATAVDIRTPTLQNADTAAVTRVEPAADFTEFIYPTLGQPRRVGVRMIDQMTKVSSL